MATVVNNRMFYIDNDGNTGEAFGMVLFDVDTMTAEEQAEYETMKEDGDITSIRQWALRKTHALDALEGFRYITSKPIKQVMTGKGGTAISHLIRGNK